MPSVSAHNANSATIAGLVSSLLPHSSLVLMAYVFQPTFLTYMPYNHIHTSQEGVWYVLDGHFLFTTWVLSKY